MFVLVFCHSLHHRLTFPSLLLACFTKNSKRRRKREGSDLVNYSLAIVFLMARPQSGKDMNMLLLTYCTTWMFEPSGFLDPMKPVSQCHSSSTVQFAFDDKNHKPQDWLSLGNARKTTFWLSAAFSSLITVLPWPDTTQERQLNLVWKHCELL